MVAQGLPVPANSDAVRRMMSAVEQQEAMPAITAVVSGTPTIGLTSDEVVRFLNRSGVSKVSSRDLGSLMASGGDGATTVAASLTLCRAAGVQVFATGGIGGVHRDPFDESADLVELSRSQVVVVCAGAKAILDIAATVERLESLGVSVVGYRTDEFPGFYAASTGLGVPARADEARQIADIFRAQLAVGHPGALLVVQPPPAEAALARSEVEEAVEIALDAARRQGVRGSAMTPFLLSAVERATHGRSLAVNLALLEANARLAGTIARELVESH
ncbi:MAG: Pseudouridine-5'-phosphate glycosidase [Gemmatimonadaceae bacterium]|nr:Pseudouridine-5'-phosphate glycosidase [Gemmatimonadaceae bacterium]